MEDPSLLQSLDGVLDATHPVLAGLFDEPVLAFPLGLLLDLLELLLISPSGALVATRPSATTFSLTGSGSASRNSEVLSLVPAMMRF